MSFLHLSDQYFLLRNLVTEIKKKYIIVRLTKGIMSRL